MGSLFSWFRYSGPVPHVIRVRAKSFACQTGTYVAFDKDGTCHVYPVEPIRLDQAGVWVPSGRKGMFQREEIKFTRFKYRYSDWSTLITPEQTVKVDTTFTHKTYVPTRSITKENRL